MDRFFVDKSNINLENIISNEVASSIIDFMKDKTYQDL